MTDYESFLTDPELADLVDRHVVGCHVACCRDQQYRAITERHNTLGDPFAKGCGQVRAAFVFQDIYSQLYLVASHVNAILNQMWWSGGEMYRDEVLLGGFATSGQVGLVR
ncbi:MAG: hypothetical protein FRX49_06109 [Trebouxia sp. A1-2]|nr:MAG: hypothetical protein FRX49_06109 [Trebouxia sp. A1-2]